jgi:UDP-N-acetylglucosamine:LPS N-acetylglucosamine transferase
VKPTVIHIRASNFFGGPERQIINHINASKKFRHLLVTFLEGHSSNELYERAVKAGVYTRLIRARNAFDPTIIMSMRHIFKDQKPHVICSHGYKPSVIALLAKVGLGIPLIIFSRGHTNENFKVPYVSG